MSHTMLQPSDIKKQQKYETCIVVKHKLQCFLKLVYHTMIKSALEKAFSMVGSSSLSYIVVPWQRPPSGPFNG